MTLRRIAAPMASLIAVSLLTLGAATSARAAVDLDSAATELRSGALVYNDPAAENALSTAEVDQLAATIRDTKLPIFVAVLPESAAGGATADETLRTLRDEVGLAGVYALVLGNQFRAGSTSGSAADLATSAFNSQRGNGVAAVLTEFVYLVDERFGSGEVRPAGGGGGVGTLIFLLVALGGAAIVVFFLVRSSRRKSAAQLAAVRSTVDEDVTEFGERLGAFSLTDPGFDDATRSDMQRALDSYDRAKNAANAMRGPNDAGGASEALEDGRYALACVEARLAQRPLPERRPPCFVDPRHGPSVADVLWSPPGLTERAVPMCAACRTAVEVGSQPQGMLVSTASGQQTPYWQAGPEYTPYARGYYSPFGGVMTGVLMGTMLSGMWAAPAAAAAPVDQAGFGGFGSSGDSDAGSGGDFGGGGGDFGGGGFGGGDFGGGGDF